MTSTLPAAERDRLTIEVLHHLDAGSCILDSQNRIAGWSDRLDRRGLMGVEWIGRGVDELLRAVCTGGECPCKALDAIERARTAGEVTSLGEEVPLELPDPVLRDHRLVIAPVVSAGREDSRRVALLFMPFHAGRQVRQHFERILDSTPDGIMVIDPQRRVRVFNSACGRLLGQDPEEVLRKSCVCGEVVHCHMEDGTSLSHNSLCPAVDLFSGTSAHQVEEMLMRTTDGEERWIETSYSAVKGPGGNVEFVIGILRDVHERKLLEQRLHQTEKLAALGQLTAGIAHEIKNPLGIILSSVEIILDEKRPKEMRGEAAQFIKEEVQRLDSRIRSFLSFARPSPPHPEPVVLNGQLRRIAAAFRGTWPELELELHLAPPEAIVFLDPDQFTQVVTNLLINAVEALDGKGRVEVHTRIDGESVVVEVHDNGPGLPEDLRSRIFDPFFTTKAHGTGLGLSIVHQMASANCGTIAAGRSPLGGALFTLTLPFRCGPA